MQFFDIKNYLEDLEGGNIIEIEIPQSDKFSLEVERLALEGYTYLEALMDLMQKYEIENEQVKKLLSPALKDKLAIESGIKHTTRNKLL